MFWGPTLAPCRPRPANRIPATEEVNILIPHRFRARVSLPTVRDHNAVCQDHSLPYRDLAVLWPSTGKTYPYYLLHERWSTSQIQTSHSQTHAICYRATCVQQRSKSIDHGLDDLEPSTNPEGFELSLRSRQVCIFASRVHTQLANQIPACR